MYATSKEFKQPDYSSLPIRPITDCIKLSNKLGVKVIAFKSPSIEVNANEPSCLLWTYSEVWEMDLKTWKGMCKLERECVEYMHFKKLHLVNA